MQRHIARHGRYIAFSAVVASALSLVAATGRLPMLARLGDAAIESYTRAISDWGQHLTEKLDPTYTRCF